MADLYNTQILDNTTNIYGVFKEINTISNNIMGSALLFLIALILIMAFRGRTDFNRLMLGVSFIVSFLAVLFFLLGLITLSGFLFPFVFLVISIIINIWGG